MGEDGTRSTKYLLIIGKLNYVSVGTRPNITYGVNCLAQFLSKPSTIHWKALNHLIGYLADTKEQTLQIRPHSLPHQPVDCYVDANWGGPSSRSSYGVLIRLFGCPLMWVLRRLVTVASSTCQAEYMALGHATRHSLWICNLLTDILGVKYPVKILCNNQLAVKIGT
jgi:hypothetical protein